MALNPASARKYLKNSDLKALFIEELGWNVHRGAPVPVAVDSTNFALLPVAEKHGVQVFECSHSAIPDRLTRQKIDRQLTKSAHEHLLVFLNPDRTEQLWQWVAREPGRPAALREQRYAKGRTGEALIQKLDHLTIAIGDEEQISITGVVQKLKDAFDKDKVTKRFYERFKTEHANFLKLIDGIADGPDREWYASLMLNRLMFVYFVQKKGFLDNDTNYLRNRLARLQASRKDRFHSFYRHFLMRLFHEGLGHQPPRTSELDELLGTVPYLNGGLFDVHELETENRAIQIPDRAFEGLFDFFDAYEWHLDERPLEKGNEINPDVLGYIFEKYINQKQMGAYYTKEDITEYISKSTVIPYLFDAAEKDCAIAFRSEGPLWGLLRNDPDRYMFAAVLRGVDEPLPANIAAGIGDVAKRAGWNRQAAHAFSLPTETWREHVARRSRCLELRSKLHVGEVHSINDVITYNLDIRQLAQDAIEQAEGPELVRAFFKAIREINILDPAVGSGAFLFAALNILEPLYDACLDRMQAFIDDAPKGRPENLERYVDFREVLEQMAKHPNREYFILKSIVIDNLYGVDIMEEAVEICKLRLFLKLVAQLERADEIEPLPDMDFNIRAGNTLVGFSSLGAVRDSMAIMPGGQRRIVSNDDQAALDQIENDAAIADEAFQAFHRIQRETATDADAIAAGKAAVRHRLDSLRDSLNTYAASDYGIGDGSERLEHWRASHQPFHWPVEFYGIIAAGGFDVVIGNPPYLEQTKLDGAYSVRGYATQSCRDIYAWMIERASILMSSSGRVGLIVPISVVSSASFAPVRKLLKDRLSILWGAHFANRPGQLFEGAQNRLTILLGSASNECCQTFSTRYHRWDARHGERASLLDLMQYAQVDAVGELPDGLIPKVGSSVAASVLRKLFAQKPLQFDLAPKSLFPVFWVRVPGYFCQFYIQPPLVTPEKGGPPRERGELLRVFARSEPEQRLLFASLNSSTYIQFYYSLTDGRHINPSDVRDFPLGASALAASSTQALANLGDELLIAMDAATVTRRKSGLLIEAVDSRPTKPILDRVDAVLASHYGFSPVELDFIINYDIKYRMGAEDDGDDS